LQLNFGKTFGLLEAVVSLMTMASQDINIRLEGGGPWGFRLTGGKDFCSALTVSKVCSCIREAKVLRIPQSFHSIAFITILFFIHGYVLFL
jgi:hypothetical protein